MSPQNIPPTEQEIERAFDVISRAAKTRQSSGETDAELAAFRQQQEKNKALVAECDKLQDVIYQHLLDAMPKDLKELFEMYGLMVIAPYAVNRQSIKVFRSFSRCK
jgi:hypothetical protein